MTAPRCTQGKPHAADACGGRAAAGDAAVDLRPGRREGREPVGAVVRSAAVATGSRSVAETADADSVVHPRSVTPGIETQYRSDFLPDPGVYCRVDWLRLTGSDRLLESVIALAEEWFGPFDRPTGGAMWFTGGLEWDPGVQVSYGHRSSICMLDIRGERLTLMNGDSIVELLASLMELGLHPTRIDGAIDWIGQDVRLHEQALASCRAGELCRSRTYASDSEFTVEGVPKRHLLKLGKRESAICVRIYDKGLQRKLAPPGHWERLEVEFKGDRARSCASILVQHRDSWCENLGSLVVGAVDFRERNGRTETARRPRAEWWASLLADFEPRQCKPIVDHSGFNQWLDWFGASCGRRLAQFAQLVGEDVGVVVAALIQDASPCKHDDRVAREFVLAWRRLAVVVAPSRI